jgi:hypothetical protein
MPRRADEVLDGGSIYWVIRGQVRVRQRILGLSAESDEEGHRYCAVRYQSKQILTLPQARRPFQGWRYLRPDEAPPDRAIGGRDDELPPAMAQELRALGLL